MAFYGIYDALTVQFTQFLQPLVAGVITGAILGNLEVGMIVGGTLQLTALGLYTYGGASIPDFMSAAMLAVVFAVDGHIAPLTAVALSLPIAVFLIQLDVLARTINTAFIHMADRAVEEGKFGRITYLSWLGLFPWGFSRFIPVFVGTYYGQSIATYIDTVIPHFINNGFIAVGAVLPVVGLTLLLTYLPVRKYVPFLIIGYFFAAYLAIPLLGITLIVLGLALIYFELKGEDMLSLLPGRRGRAARAKEAEAPAPGAAAGPAGGGGTAYLTKRDIRWLYIKQLFHFQVAWNYERMQALDYLYNITHILKKVYKTPDELKEAYKLHLQFYNTNPNTHCFIQGMDVALEEQQGSASLPTVTGIKAGLMGPLAGVGDAVFYTTLDVIVLAIGASLVLSGFWEGALLAIGYGLFVLVPVRWIFIREGYNSTRGMAAHTTTETLSKVTEFVGTIGLAIVGALIFLYVSIHTPITYTTTVNGTATTVVLQNLLNSIFPGLIPVLFAAFAYMLYVRKFSVLRVLLIVFLIAWVLGALGWLI